MGLLMSQFWVGRLRIWGLLFRSLRRGGRGYGGWYVAVLRWEVEDMGAVMSQFWAGRLRMRGLLIPSLLPGG